MAETPDTIERLRAEVNDLAQTMGEQLGELRRELDALVGGQHPSVQLINAERLTVGPNDAIIIRLPAEAFQYPIDEVEGEPVANVIARVAADVLGTRRVLVIEDAAQIDVGALPPDGARHLTRVPDPPEAAT